MLKIKKILDKVPFKNFRFQLVLLGFFSLIVVLVGFWFSGNIRTFQEQILNSKNTDILGTRQGVEEVEEDFNRTIDFKSSKEKNMDDSSNQKDEDGKESSENSNSNFEKNPSSELYPNETSLQNSEQGSRSSNPEISENTDQESPQQPISSDNNTQSISPISGLRGEYEDFIEAYEQ